MCARGHETLRPCATVDIICCYYVFLARVSGGGGGGGRHAHWHGSFSAAGTPRARYRCARPATIDDGFRAAFSRSRGVRQFRKGDGTFGTSFETFENRPFFFFFSLQNGRIFVGNSIRPTDGGIPPWGRRRAIVPMSSRRAARCARAPID